MPTNKVKKKSRQLKSEGKAPSTQASPFIEEEIYQLHKKKRLGQKVRNRPLL